MVAAISTPNYFLLHETMGEPSHLTPYLYPPALSENSSGPATCWPTTFWVQPLTLNYLAICPTTCS